MLRCIIRIHGTVRYSQQLTPTDIWMKMSPTGPGTGTLGPHVVALLGYGALLREYLTMAIWLFGNLSVYRSTPFPDRSLLHPCIVRCVLSASCSNCHVCCSLPCSPAPAIKNSYSSGTISPNKLFLPCVATVVRFYHRNKKVTTIGLQINSGACEGPDQVGFWRNVRLWEL